MNGQEKNTGADDGRIRLTRELLLECQNDELVSFVGLQVHKPHVAAAIADHYVHRQRYNVSTLDWESEVGVNHPGFRGTPRGEGIYRLDPALKTGPRTFDVDVEPQKREKNGSCGYEIVRHPVSKQPMCVALCLAHPDCRGFWYVKPDGVKWLTTTLDVSFGKLIGVRFEIE